jgi:hypothetical protein
MSHDYSKKSFLGFAFTIALALTGFAQTTTEQKVEFYLDGKIGSEVVKKGAYKIVIPESEQGAIEIKAGKKVVTAQFVKRAIEKEADKDKMTYIENSDGTRSIASITPRGRKYTLVLSEGSVANSK